MSPTRKKQKNVCALVDTSELNANERVESTENEYSKIKLLSGKKI